VKRIGIIGFGALGQQVLALVAPGGQTEVFYFDDALHAKGAANSVPFDSFLDTRFADCDFFVGLGYRHLQRRAATIRELAAARRRTPSWIHPSCQVHPDSRIGEGCFLYPLCNVGSNVELFDGVLLNNSVVVSHDSQIGTASYLSPGVVISGRVRVGEAAFLGSGTLVADNRRIGPNARIGIGTVVTIDVPAAASAIGNPIRLLDGPLELD